MNARERILKAGARIIHQEGFYSTGLAKVLEAAEVPKGSFYFHFKNKEDFGLHLIDYFAENLRAKRNKIYREQGLSHIEKMREIFKSQAKSLSKNDFKGGCPLGNLAQETADCNEKFRKKLDQVFMEIKKELALQLELAKKSGEISGSLDCDETADFIMNSWEGTLMEMKVSKCIIPHKVFERMVFERLLVTKQ